MAYSGSIGARRARQAFAGGIAALAVCGIAARDAVAGDTGSGDSGATPRTEMWSGVDMFQRFRSAYAGATWAPFGGIREDGFRLRGVLGFGSYDADPDSRSIAFGDVLIGYHKQLGSLTIKVLGGITVRDGQLLSLGGPPEDIGLDGKGVLEAWWNMSDRAWSSLDTSLSTTDLIVASRIRLGWRLWPELSAGLEAGSGGTLAPTFALDSSRLGAFLRYEWTTGEASISGGVALDDTQRDRDDEPGPFVTVSVLTRF